jgi:UDP-N-acetylglucosamine--N-acetylmuramyl-(pentapeptide) pyrophosphoryl-undecaprenol N-acetylglucosamine transferase
MKSLSANAADKPLVAIACGGTGGHLFPGLAVGDELVRLGCRVLLLISPKDVDQRSVSSAIGMEVTTLPAVGLTRGRALEFAKGFWKSFTAARKLFRERPPQAVLAMGGFTSAPPVLAGKQCGAVTFLHESNTIPGRANRWLAHVVHQAFVGFPSTAGRLHHTNIVATGTPVRPQFQPADPEACRIALGLHPLRPLLLIMGGSQGATGVNDLVIRALPQIVRGASELQFLHLTGPNDVAKVQNAYALHQCKATVLPFLTEMELALGGATLAISRAGASSLAELAAMQLPSILIPFPAAADNHQFHNARAFVDSGAAAMVEQNGGTGEKLAGTVLELMNDKARHAIMREKLAQWHSPHAAQLIAKKMLLLMEAMGHGRKQKPACRKPASGVEAAQMGMVKPHVATNRASLSIS